VPGVRQLHGVSGCGVIGMTESRVRARTHLFIEDDKGWTEQACCYSLTKAVMRWCCSRVGIDLHMPALS
jgi:hypothetical protein